MIAVPMLLGKARVVVQESQWPYCTTTKQELPSAQTFTCIHDLIELDSWRYVVFQNLFSSTSLRIASNPEKAGRSMQIHIGAESDKSQYPFPSEKG